MAYFTNRSPLKNIFFKNRKRFVSICMFAGKWYIYSYVYIFCYLVTMLWRLLHWNESVGFININDLIGLICINCKECSIFVLIMVWLNLCIFLNFDLFIWGKASAKMLYRNRFCRSLIRVCPCKHDHAFALNIRIYSHLFGLPQSNSWTFITIARKSL